MAIRAGCAGRLVMQRNVLALVSFESQCLRFLRVKKIPTFVIEHVASRPGSALYRLISRWDSSWFKHHINQIPRARRTPPGTAIPISQTESMNSTAAYIRVTDTFYRKIWATNLYASGLIFYG
jgi:hypothetical protein